MRAQVAFRTLPVLLALVASSAHAASFGILEAESTGASCSPVPGLFAPGQSVDLSGTGFAASAAIEVLARWETTSGGDEIQTLANVVATSGGALDTIVVLPSDIPVGALFMLEALGDDPSAGIRSLKALAEAGASYSVNTDGDSKPNICDNCPDDNAPQTDSDGDLIGDACDSCPADPEPDFDGDTLCHSGDPCPGDPENDADGDGVCEFEDNCPTDWNPSQADTDGNTVGDACQTLETCRDTVDNDGDGLKDANDPGCANIFDATETNAGVQCDNGIDDDNDTLTDFRTDGSGDPGCKDSESGSENPKCDNDMDDDGDGLTDWDGGLAGSMNSADPSCIGKPWRNNEADNDQDGVNDVDDTCPKVADPGQEVVTVEPRLLGIGCACLCGDVNRDCNINSTDGLEIAYWLGFQPPILFFDEDYCDINGDELCNSSDRLEIILWAGFAPPQLAFDPEKHCSAIN